MLKRVFTDLTEAIDRSFGWHALPLPLALITFIGLRMRLRERNLYFPATKAERTAELPPISTPSAAPSDEPATPMDAEAYLTSRTADGTCNDLDEPVMGSAGTRFGRNVPLKLGYPEPMPKMLTPNPRVISRELLTRHTFVPATTLNILAAAWLQFMIRDWLSHGKSPQDDPWTIPLPPGDDWPQPTMTIPRTPDDPTRTPADAGFPPTHINTETHWWDASQIYGSSKDVQMKVRSGRDGKLIVDSRGLPPLDAGAVSRPGFWIGLGMMQALFTLEHNAICDRLRTDYPAWPGEEIFQRARLINAALIAKIHTVEWTPAIIAHPTTKVAMHANWWGLEMERIHNAIGRLSKSEVISGIPGSPHDHFGVPYAMTEEFVAVYKMHALIPDDYVLRSSADDSLLQEADFPHVANQGAVDLLGRLLLADLFYSFGVAHPGAIQLHNYPRTLQRFLRPDGNYMDLASVDILRARELGVPRYNEFRQLLHKNPVRSFEELTDNPTWREELRRVYEGDIERVDPMVGLYAEPKPPGFGFSDTAFRIFILMASRRLNSDRFFTDDFTPRVYTRTGMDWIEANDMSTVVLRHFPQLAPSLRGVQNTFAPWGRV
jgi:Animal haem peroxidase